MEGDILIYGTIIGLARTLALEKLQGIHRYDPARTLSNNEEVA